MLKIKKIILVTGANGFVGSALVKRLANEDDATEVVAAVRRLDITFPEGVKSRLVHDLLSSTDWSSVLKGIDAIVHCAGRVHVMKDLVDNPLKAYRDVNVFGTINLARQAAEAGVRRFVFVSSVKVNGDNTIDRMPFTGEDTPAPLDPYGVSKLEAEQGLREVSKKTGMEVVIVRPPLVYGLGVKANFESMLRWVARGVPLPLGSIHNSRSMVSLDNLVDLLSLCLKHPAAPSQIFMVSDGENISTTELLIRTARAMNKSIYLLPVPASWLEFGAALLGKRELAQRLCGSLEVDIEKTRVLLGWNPPLTFDNGLKKAVKGMTL